MSLNKVLKDIQVKNGASLDNKMIKARIVDNDLVIVVEFDNARISALQYLELRGVHLKNIGGEELKNLIDMIVFPSIKG